MTVTLAYDDTLGRVSVSADGLAGADTATIERSVDQIRWTTVRGGTGLTVTGGALERPVDDYEFPATGVPVVYRVRGHESGPITYVGVGAAAAGDNASLTPAFPSGLVAGDLLVTLASIRPSLSGTVNTPTGWEQLAASQNVALLGRRYTTGLAASQVTFGGGSSGATTLAQTAAFRRADLTPVTSAALNNASGQNINYPGVAVDDDGRLILVAGWKQDDWTSVDVLAGGFAEIGENSSTAGSDAAHVWDYLIQTAAADIGAGAFTVTGGGGAVSRGLTLVLQHAAYLNEQTASITPDVRGRVWLKSVARPFLNLPVQVVLGNTVSVTKPSKSAVFEIQGRSLPVGVSQPRGSARFPLQLRTETDNEADHLDYILASGDTLYLQGNRVAGVQTAYVEVGDVGYAFHPLRVQQRTYTLPCTAVAAPGPDVVGALSTCASVLAAYATCEELLANHATCASLLTLVGDGTEVIVG